LFVVMSDPKTGREEKHVKLASSQYNNHIFLCRINEWWWRMITSSSECGQLTDVQTEI